MQNCTAFDHLRAQLVGLQQIGVPWLLHGHGRGGQLAEAVHGRDHEVGRRVRLALEVLRGVGERREHSVPRFGARKSQPRNFYAVGLWP